MKDKDDLVYLKDILNSITRIEEYIQSKDYEEFSDDTMLQDAIIRNLITIGEASKKLSNDMREEFSHIPWKEIAGVRDVFIHKYAEVRLSGVWSTIVSDLPPLKNAVKEAIELHDVKP